MSTEQYSGIGEGKPSSKVLKPPGGGSSNIFGVGPSTPQDKPKPASAAEQGAAAASVQGAAAAASAAAPFSTPENVAEPKQKRGQIFVHRNPITHEITDYSKVVQKSAGEAAVVENKPEAKREDKKEEEKPSTRSKKIPPGGASSLKFF